jgi:hypothetical protein
MEIKRTTGVINLHRKMTFTQVTKRSLVDINRFNDDARRIAMSTAMKHVTDSYAVLQVIWPGAAGRGEAEGWRGG